MDRREFLEKSVQYGLSFGAAALLGNFDKVFSQSVSASKKIDMVAVRNAEPDAMFREGIKAYGGIGTFVKKGQTVVVKPNIGWDVLPQYAANTNPKLVAEIVKQCKAAGASKVYVFDNTCDYWANCYKNSGIQAAATAAGAEVVAANTIDRYTQVTINGAKVLKTCKVHNLILYSDVYINVPILKAHSSASLSIAMKNQMGIVWDRGFWHSNDLFQCIADFTLFRKPTLNVVDAYSILLRNGPRGVNNLSDVATPKMQIITQDIVAADAAAVKIFDPKRTPAGLGYIKYAAKMGSGNMDLATMNIKKIDM